MTGINIIKAILRGERDPQALANLSVAKCRKKMDVIAKALEGHYRKEHVFALSQAYEAYEFFHDQINKCEKEIQATLHVNKPFAKARSNQNCIKKADLKQRTIVVLTTSTLALKLT